MAASLKVDVSIMPDFPTPPPHSDASSTTSSASPSSSSSTSSKARSTVVGGETTPPPSASYSCPNGPDYDQHGNKIKRPMNAFMVWAQMRRAEITAVSSKVHNSTISKALGVEWREMSEEAKQPYVQKAKELRDELFREHPHYVYRPRKRKTRPAPYSPRPGAMQNTTASLPAGSATCAPQLLLAPSSSTSPPSLAALLLQQPATCAAEQLQHMQQQSAAATPTADANAPLAHPQMPLFAPGLLQQLQQSAALAAIMQHQQQQQQPLQQPAAAAAMMNPLLLANLLNPLFAQMLTQFVTSPSSQ